MYQRVSICTLGFIIMQTTLECVTDMPNPSPASPFSSGLSRVKRPMVPPMAVLLMAPINVALWRVTTSKNYFDMMNRGITRSALIFPKRNFLTIRLWGHQPILQPQHLHFHQNHNPVMDCFCLFSFSFFGQRLKNVKPLGRPGYTSWMWIRSRKAALTP